MPTLGRALASTFALSLLFGCSSSETSGSASESGGTTGVGGATTTNGGAPATGASAGVSGGTTGGTGGSIVPSGGAASGGAASGGAASGGAVGTGGDATATGGTGEQPRDCSALTSAGFQVCEATADHCAAVFTDGTGCVDVCDAAGLKCAAAYDNVDGMCAATTTAVACNSGHGSDYCVCDETGGGQIIDPPDPPTGPVATGYASTASNGLNTTTGGGNAAPNTVTTCADLKTYLGDAQARVIEIPAGTTLDCRTAPRTQQACELQCSKSAATPVFWRIPVTGQDCTTLADTNGDGTLDIPAGKLVNKVRREVSMKVGSNKTLRGLGSGATLLGVSLDIENQSNIIIQNLKISEINPDLVEAGDGVTINTSHHVWVDHCEFSMISDGYLDIRYGSKAVTVSNNHIVGKNQYVCGGQHHYISLVSDSQATYSHNYFDYPSGRNPKVTGDADVHLYSNYYAGVSYFCASAGTGARVLVEGNYYKDSRYPHWVDGGQIEASGNQYAGTTSADHRDSNANLAAPPYTYTLDTVSSLPTSVPAAAGPGKL